MHHYHMITGKKQADYLDNVIALRKQVWPDFIRVPDATILKLYEWYPDFQISLFDCDTEELIAIANAVPLIWHEPLAALSDQGVSWVLNEALTQLIAATLSNFLCAVSISVAVNYRHQGLSEILLKQLKAICKQHSLTQLVVPVRPSDKSRYPLIAIEDYLQWKNPEGLPFDPWLRTHIKLGARVIKLCEHSAMVTASVKTWEQWTGMYFPGDGAYLIKGALNPIEINLKDNVGTYVEPNVWVQYLA